jgi:hypothetical protein
LVFDPAGFYRLAQVLVANTHDEASLRSSIGRAYYACHLTARDSIFGVDHNQLSSTARGREFKNLSDHHLVIRAVGEHSNAKGGAGKRMADQMLQLKEMREGADYYRDPSGRVVGSIFTKYDVRTWEELANQAMAIASNILPELGRLQRR